MTQTKILMLAVICLFVLIQFTIVQAGEKGEDTIIVGGEHGCGPKLLLKTGGKKKGDILVMNNCKKHKETHYIPMPYYYSHGGGYGGGHGGGY